VLQQTLQRMREECAAEGRQDVWEVFQHRLLGPCLLGTAPLEYDALVQRLGFESPSQASNVLITAKRLFGRGPRAVIAEYTSDDEAIESEIGDLRTILAGRNA
jgi:hypothetical protein